MDIADLFVRHSDAPDALREGYYVHRRAGYVDKAVRVWFGPPVVDGVALDRSWRWQVTVNGRSVFEPGGERLEHIWPRCERWPSNRDDHDYMVALVEHDREHDPMSPFASSAGKVDLLRDTIETPGA